MGNLTLASGDVTPTAKLIVELVDDEMQMIVIHWPAKPTPVSPTRYTEIASRAMRVLANASTELAARRRPRPRVVDDEEDEE